jgi:hypothetical protein
MSFRITENISVLSTSNKGWTKEVNFVEWFGKKAKLDIRDWSPDHSAMGKGVTLTEEEAKALKEVLNTIEL